MRKRILVVINTLGRAGAETALMALLKQFNPDEYEVELYVCLGQGEMIDQVPDYVKVINKDYCKESVLSASGRITLYKRLIKRFLSAGEFKYNMSYIFNNYMELRRAGKRVGLDKLLWKFVSESGDVNDTEYDLAIAYIEGASAYYVRDKIKAKKKVGFIHIDYGMAGYNRELDENCYMSYTRVFAVSDEVRENFLKIYPEISDRVYVFHNLIDIDRVESMSRLVPQETLPDDSINLLTVCRLTPQKSLEVAVEALSILRERGHNIRWYIVGDGPQKSMLNRLIKKLELEDYFILLGARDNPYPYYRMADFYVHATRFEGKSIAIQEAQILGRRIIASDCSGNREQIEHDVDGLLCEFSPEGIADSVELMLNSSSKWEDYTRSCRAKTFNHYEEMEYLYELLRE